MFVRFTTIIILFVLHILRVCVCVCSGDGGSAPSISFDLPPPSMKKKHITHLYYNLLTLRSFVLVCFFFYSFLYAIITISRVVCSFLFYNRFATFTNAHTQAHTHMFTTPTALVYYDGMGSTLAAVVIAA